ncbi:MAG: hypothetical protein DGJ47_000828 [Rickettsiaceae bacterium]
MFNSAALAIFEFDLINEFLNQMSGNSSTPTDFYQTYEDIWSNI